MKSTAATTMQVAHGVTHYTRLSCSNVLPSRSDSPVSLRAPLAKASIVAVGFLLTVETAVRVSDWARFGTPVSSGATSIGDLYVVDRMGVHPRPSAQYERYRINGAGFRGPDFVREAHRGPVIVVMGSSETFGLPESPSMEWPRQLEVMLRRQCRPDVAVINAGFAGTALPSARQDLELRIRQLRPDAVVYYPQPTQYLGEKTPKATPPSQVDVAPLPSWRPRALRRLRDRIKQELPSSMRALIRRAEARKSRARSERFAGLPMDRIASFEHDLRAFVGTARSTTTTVALVAPQHRFSDTTSYAERDWLRVWEKFIPKASADILLAFSDSGTAVVERIARDSSLAVVRPQLATGTSRAKHFADFLHFTDSGAALVAQSASLTLAPYLSCKPITPPEP